MHTQWNRLFVSHELLTAEKRNIWNWRLPADDLIYKNTFGRRLRLSLSSGLLDVSRERAYIECRSVNREEKRCIRLVLYFFVLQNFRAASKLWKLQNYSFSSHCSTHTWSPDTNRTAAQKLCICWILMGCWCLERTHREKQQSQKLLCIHFAVAVHQSEFIKTRSECEFLLILFLFLPWVP